MSGDDVTFSEYIFDLCMVLVPFGVGTVLGLIILCVIYAIAFSPFIIAIGLFNIFSKTISKIYKERIIKECIKIYCEILELQKELTRIPYREDDFVRSVCNNNDRVHNLKQLKKQLLITRKQLTEQASAKNHLNRQQ